MTVMQTKQGQVEVEIFGNGIPVLILHGSPGGVDAAKVMGRFLPDNVFQKITMSRPGYLQTPLGHHQSIDAEADLVIALLDALDIRRVAILAWSGGGPVAYRLAVRYPKRVRGLVMVAAVSEKWDQLKVPLASRLMFGTSVGQRFVQWFARSSPERLIYGAIEAEGKLNGDEVKALMSEISSQPQQQADMLALILTVGTGGDRKAGYINDLRNFGRIAALELSRIRCPVLLVHGDADSEADIAHSRNAHAAIAHSELVVVPRGTHLVLYAGSESGRLQRRVQEFISSTS